MNLRMPFILAALTFSSLSAIASFLPDDFVPRRMNYAEAQTNDMTQEEFDGIIAAVETAYRPIIGTHGATLRVVGNWEDDTINAFARQVFSTWEVQMFGGLARLPTMTNDAFAMVMCHELGHHIAGFPIKPGAFGLSAWAANEGQSDYFAAQVCGPKIWENDLEVNASFRLNVDPSVQASCDAVHTEVAQQNMCFRISAAGLSLSRTLAFLWESPEPQYDTPNPKVVPVTNHKHPEAQCRLDTTLAGALCTIEFDELSIPGKDAEGGVKSPEAEKEAADTSCMRVNNHETGARPLCWFKPGLEEI